MCPGEAVLPDALEKVGTDVFYSCPEIKAIWVGNSSVADSLRRGYCPDSVTILPARSTMVGDRLLWDLRKLKEVVIPEGVQEIGERWFINSKLESVTIPASVTAIGKEAFCGCKNLKEVVFEAGSVLKKIDDYAF